MLNKKAIVAGEIILLILFVVSLAGALYIGYKLMFDEGIKGSLTQSFCAASANVRGHFVVHGLLGVVNIHLIPEFCRTQAIDTYPSVWEKCPYYSALREAKGLERERVASTCQSKTDSTTGKPLAGEALEACIQDEIGRISKDEKKEILGEYYTKCAIEQVARLAVKCWETRGQGNLDPGPFECYTTCIKGPGVTMELQKALDDAEKARDRAKTNLDAAESADYGDDLGRKEWTVEPLQEKYDKANLAYDTAKTAYEESVTTLEYLGALTVTYPEIVEVINEADYASKRKFIAVMSDPGAQEDDGSLRTLNWLGEPDDSKIGTGALLGIQFDDDWKPLFGLVDVDRDVIYLRRIGSCR